MIFYNHHRKIQLNQRYRLGNDNISRDKYFIYSDNYFATEPLPHLNTCPLGIITSAGFLTAGNKALLVMCVAAGLAHPASPISP